MAVKMGRKLLIGERTIVTPAARDAGEAANVFVHAGLASVNRLSHNSLTLSLTACYPACGV